MVLTPEEKRLRAARRFGRIGLIWTTLSFLFVPAFALLPGWDPPGAVAVLAVLFVAALVLHVWRIRQHIRVLGTVAPAWYAVVTSLVGLALVWVGAASSPTGWMWAIIGGILLGDIVAGLRARFALLWVAVAVVVSAALAFQAASYVDSPLVIAQQVTAAILTAVYVGSFWILDVERLWWLKAVTDLDDSRRTAAQLATTRERLRLADDLHDILGHALEVVAFKSELAARLQEVDPVRARAEMEEVQRVARESLTEVRALVRSGRDTDLAAELAGARAVLGSAGIVLQVTGDPSLVPEEGRNVLGRVLREGMTNVLRHAQPSHCSIEITPNSLVLCNDGVGGDGWDSDGTGTGLVGLTRYLEEHSGRLQAGRDGGTFRLEAVLG
ncbi:sensor histidine kinase [Pseudonocardia oroxyli]|uniref:Two-component system, NarL family, sensor histidine kinase DesK n=1 Tax=Pseudonocardia oroxyli TaxID=366584 RepID=A0A1G7LBP5_PSEOR|nr:histidine kinase [Pseudonocardia oroxyli]SDF46875.1 two-component system, NarL family, sensor histidine kinase DesK [Pseudonocardia oroxyli]